MYTEKTYTVTDIFNKATNWFFNLKPLPQFIILAGAIIILAENAPKTNNFNYISLIPQPKPQRRQEFSESDKKTTRYHQWFRCDECHEFNSNLEFHHKDGQNWNNDISNCQGLCPNCHVKKHLKPKLF